jgi:hypothetical protein
MKKILLFLICFSFLFTQKIDVNKMNAKEIANLVYKYIVNKLPLKLSRYEIITQVLALDNILSITEEIDLVELMHFSNEYSEIINLLKKYNKNFDEIKFLKKNLSKKDLKIFLNNLKSVKMQEICFKKNSYFFYIFLKKGGVFEKRFYAIKLNKYIGKFQITKEDCKKINPYF